MTLLCITNEMDDWRSCTIRDAHTVRCENPDTCTGCLPRLAQVGLLCYPCWDRVEHAFADWTTERARIMGSIDRAVQRDTGGRSSGPEGYVPIPGTRLAVDEVESYLRGDWTNARAWVSTDDGARHAIKFAGAVSRALRTHELEERPHKVRRTRCNECGQLTLVWNPPSHFRAPVRVVCSNEECGAILDQSSFTVLAQIEENAQKDRTA
jgi:hypothetical protein